MVEPLLDLDHQGKVIARVSVNPEDIINKVEFGTSRLKGRIDAINKLKEAGYEVGIIIAPVIFVENWKEQYLELIQRLNSKLSAEVKKDVFFEIIFMTYSYVHTKINEEAFPNAINLYNKEIMTGRGKGKYMYKNEYRKDINFIIHENSTLLKTESLIILVPTFLPLTALIKFSGSKPFVMTVSKSDRLII
mgnify:CR=1 FL=1